MLAIVMGGGIGYVRYRRGRVFHSKLDLDVEVELCQTHSLHAALKIAASIKNDGTSRVAFPGDTVQEIQVSVCYPRSWDRAMSTLTRPEWTLYYAEAFGVDDDQELALATLEPGQRALRQVLVPGVESPEPVGYRVRLYVEGCPFPLFRMKKHSPWSTERVIEVKPKDDLVDEAKKSQDLPKGLVGGGVGEPR